MDIKPVFELNTFRYNTGLQGLQGTQRRPLYAQMKNMYLIKLINIISFKENYLYYLFIICNMILYYNNTMICLKLSVLLYTAHWLLSLSESLHLEKK